ncbi:uncharacterized protein LOC123566031 [Mercenaria mercenaria]|uniref:uncharacterized protein LOC123566031 n=1 Tax=Mercenaria mercenaria TaxID=6596 RepID=UPI001E1D5F21|nr:uncharacterized protein LOC123566031 [Mercenaria mercenaria]XP_045215790.1 uncharacterized protein LOC123566031 [Mercenaria mercenaria]
MGMCRKFNKGKLSLSYFAAFLVCVFLLFTENDSKIRQISPNSNAMFVPNHFNKTYRIGVLIMCNYKDNRDSLSLMATQLLEQNIPSIYRTVENGHIYNIYVGVTESVREQVSSQYNDLFVMSLDNNTFSDGINSLATKALSDQIEYFALSSFSAEFNLNTWTSQAIYSLKGHCPSDVGVVLQYCCNTNTIAIVHRTHFNLFGNLLPPKLNITDSIAWLRRMYFSNHLSTLPVNTEPYNANLLKRAIHEYERKDISLKNSLQSDKTLCVISYSLYGSDPRYIAGALQNSYLLTIVYPGWHLWIYHDNSVPQSILDTICNQSRTKCINMSSSAIINKRSWRFLVASERNVSRYIIRDIDSRLSFREKVAVNEWIYSGRKLHTMRDHPNQNYFINAGMWGGMSETYPNMEHALFANYLTDEYTSDSDFLTHVVWPAVKHSVMQHDSVLCIKFGGVHFPTSRIGYEHVGSVYINGTQRQNDIIALKLFKVHYKCNT